MCRSYSTNVSGVAHLDLGVQENASVRLWLAVRLGPEKMSEADRSNGIYVLEDFTKCKDKIPDAQQSTMVGDNKDTKPVRRVYIGVGPTCL